MLDLVEVLHRALGVGKILKHLVLHGVNPVESHGNGGLGSYYPLLGGLALLVYAFQLGGLRYHRRRERRVGLLRRYLRSRNRQKGESEQRRNPGLIWL